MVQCCYASHSCYSRIVKQPCKDLLQQNLFFEKCHWIQQNQTYLFFVILLFIKRFFPCNHVIKNTPDAPHVNFWPIVQLVPRFRSTPLFESHASAHGLIIYIAFWIVVILFVATTKVVLGIGTWTWCCKWRWTWTSYWRGTWTCKWRWIWTCKWKLLSWTWSTEWSLLIWTCKWRLLIRTCKCMMLIWAS
jgi:hypothetical protein